MSTNIDNRLHKSNDTPSMSLKSALSLGSESESARTVSMNKAATTTYLNSLSYEQDDVGDSLSRSMNKLNQSLSQAASANHESAVDEQAEKMAVYSKLAGKLIDRDSSLQEKVAQDLSKNSNIVRTKDASESLQKAMGNLPSALKEGTQAGKDLAKFMVENLVTLSDRKQMGAGLERDLAVRQINIPKSQPNSRLQNASSKVLSASIEYVKNNQPEVLTKIAAQEASQAKAQSQAALASETMNSAKSTDNSDAPDSTYLSALKAQRAQQNKTQAPDTSTKPSAPQDKISAEISKRIHNLIAQAAQTAKSGNLINLSPEEAERFDRTITSQNQQAQVKGDPLERILSNTSVNAADGELPPPSKQTPEANVRQLSLSELSARASKLQSQFRQERMRIVQEGKLPDPAQMPETNFDKDSIKATIDASKQQQESVQNQQRASHTSSLYESLARARSAFSAHNITSEAAAQEQPATTESKPAPQTTEQKPATQADSKPLTSESKPATTESKPAPQTTEQKPATQADSKPLTSESKPVTTESKPAPQTTEQKPATQADSKPLTSESKPVTTESKPAPQSTEQKPAATADSKPTTLEAKPNNFGSTSVNLSFNAIQSSSYGGMDIMPGMTIPVSHFGNLDNDTIQPNQKALEALKLQARLLEAQISSAEQELLKSKQVTESTNKPVENLNTPKAPVSDGDEALTQQQVSKPSIVPNGDTSKAPVADGDEALTQQQVSKPSIVPNGDTSKATVADGDEALVQQQGAKPGVMSGGADAEIEESLIVPKPNVVVEGEAEFVAKEPSASMPNVAGSVPTPSDKAAPSTVGKGNLYAKLYGAMQQGHYEDAHIQQPTVSDKSTQSAQSNLGFNSELAKPMGSSSSSIAGAGALNGVALTEDAEITLEDGEPNTSNLVAKEQAKGPAVAPDKAVVSDEDVSAKTATHTSATDVSKTKEVLAERAQEAQKQQEVLKDKQATKEERLENKQDKQVKEEQVVQEEFVATMQARAQKAEIAVEQAALRAIQAQNTAPGGGHIDEDGGSVNQFSRLYQNTLSEQKTEQARVLGSSQVNTVGDTNIKATGTTIASNTTQNTEEANQNAPQNQVTGNRTHTVGTTTVEQANRLLGAGDASTNAPTPQTQAHSAQGTQGAALTQGAQGSAAQTQSQSQTQGTVQGQAPAPSTNAPSAQGQTPAQGSVQAPNTTTSPNTPTTNQNVQSAAPSTSSANPSVGSVAGTQSVEGAANKGMMPMPNMSAPVINLDEDSLQDEIIKNVMQTVPSDEFEEFNLKNGPLGNQALSGVIADTDLTEDNNSFNQILNKSQGITNNMLSSLSDPATVIPTTSAVGASQITSGENAPIPEESVVNNINTPKEGGFFRRLASLFGRKEESAPVASENIDKSVDPSKVALEKGIGQSEGTTKAQESAVAIANLRTNSLDALVSRLQSATTDQALPPKMQEQAQNLIKALQNPVHDLKTVSSWLNFVTGPMSPSSSQAMALHQWAFMLLCIRFEQIGKNVDKFLKKTANGDQKLASLEPAIKEHAKLTKELDEVSVNKSHELLKETFGQVERMQQQMQSIPQDQSVLRYIPLPPNYQGGKEGSFSAQKRQDEDGGTSWHLNFNLDLENLGGLQVKVKLRFPEIQMSFVAEKFETLQKVQAHMPELNARLKEIGLTSKGSNARLGAVNFMQPSKESSKSKFKFEGNAFNVDA